MIKIRKLIKTILYGLIVLMIASCGISSDEYFIQTVKIPEGYSHEQKVELSARVLPHPRQMKWFEDEFFGFIHYGPNTYTGREWGTGHESSAVFNPADPDTDQWCKLMKAAGITRVIMVAKHHEGYCLWQTRYTDHSVASSPWRNGQGDLLSNLVGSCEKYGLRLGVYLSPADLYQIESPGGYYGNKSEFSERVIPRKVEDSPYKDKRTFKFIVDDYNEYFLNQLFELLTEYGPMYEVWFDGANPKPGTGQTYTYDAWYTLIRELAPDAVIFGKGPDIRWCGNESGGTRDAEYNVIPLEESPDTYIWPDKTNENIAGRDMITENTRYFHYYPAETNTSIRHGWFWRNDDEQQVRNADDVFDMYERSVGGNSVFHLNIPPDTSGQFSSRDAEVLFEVGKRLDAVYGNNLLENASASVNNVLDEDNDTWWQSRNKEAVIEIFIPGEITVNRFLIREPIAHRGERVEEHILEARIDGSWILVAEGKTIGYKRILRFPPVRTDGFRLSITKARLQPAISGISAYYYDEPPKPVIIKRNSEGFITMGVGLSFSWKPHDEFDQSQMIYYTLDGSEPTSESIRYNKPFPLPLGGRIRAVAITGKRKGAVSDKRLGILREGWKVWDSKGVETGTGNVLDGNLRTQWVSEETVQGIISLVIDMQKEYTISGFTYVPFRTFIESYSVKISLDGEEWTKIHKGIFGNIQNDPSLRTVFFNKPYPARYVKLSNLTAPGELKRVGAAEIEILSAISGTN